MMLFSRRRGLTPVQVALQVESVTEALRNRLWNLLAESYLRTVRATDLREPQNARLLGILRGLWQSYFKWPLDTLPRDAREAYGMVREQFFQCEWYGVYDVLEFVVAACENDSINRMFSADCNRVLEEEVSAYRFVKGEFVQITGNEETVVIEEAQQLPDALQPVREHLSRALVLLADREQFDPRGSVNESIRSVQALATLLTGKTEIEFGEELRELESDLGLPLALCSAFENLFGCSRGTDGMRHALLEEPDLTFSDAKFILVSCSAFVNYVLAKAAVHGTARVRAGAPARASAAASGSGGTARPS